MKKLLLALMFLFIQILLFAQITTTRIERPQEIPPSSYYDSLSNFLGEEVHLYVGQLLFAHGTSENLRKFGYSGFLLDYTKSSTSIKNTYKPMLPEREFQIRSDRGTGRSVYDSIAGKYFHVIDFHRHPQAEETAYLYGTKYFLQLIEVESKDTVFFEYDSKFEHAFPFIVSGFFIKQKEMLVGNEYVIRGRNWHSRDLPMKDIQTAKPVDFKVGSIWKAIDLTIDDVYYDLSIILENSAGERVFISYNHAYRTNHWLFPAKEAANYSRKFGRENWLRILEGKVLIGFTEEMVLLSWGEPKRINRASYGDQWIYDEQYLYFENGKLKAFN